MHPATNTLSHAEHLNKDKKMTMQEELARKHQKEQDELLGMTNKVRDLKARLAESHHRKNPIRIGGITLKYAPKDARRRMVLNEVRDGLMGDPAAYFGTLDIRPIRKAYEFESLNERQRKQVATSYHWMIDEMDTVAVTPPKMLTDKWITPLLFQLNSLTEKEQSHFRADEKFFMSLFEELEGAAMQPVWINGLVVETLPSIMSIKTSWASSVDKNGLLIN